MLIGWRAFVSCLNLFATEQKKKNEEQTKVSQFHTKTTMMTRCTLFSLCINLLFCTHVVVSTENGVGAQAHNSTHNDRCGVWLGMSTIPGAGLGMFAGKDFQKGDLLLPVGDHVIPIVDLGRRYSKFFLWDDYTWTSHSGFLGTTKMGAKVVDVASPGIGAAVNSVMDFINVDQEDMSRYSVPGNLHRLKDPQAGAFSYHHSRMSYAHNDIRPGQELFNDYGDHWYEANLSDYVFL
jgi:hypothetical protein